MYDSSQVEEEVEGTEQEIITDNSEDSETSLHSEEVEEEVKEEVEEEVEEEVKEEVENEELLTETIFADSSDYSQYFENLQVLNFLQLAVMISIGVAICFCKGFDRK